MTIATSPGGEKGANRVEPGILLTEANIGHGSLIKADRIVVTDIDNGVIIFDGGNIKEIRKRLTQCTKPVFSLTEVAPDGGTFKTNVQLYAKTDKGFVLLCQFPLTQENLISAKQEAEFLEWLERIPDDKWVDIWGKRKRSSLTEQAPEKNKPDAPTHDRR